MRGKQATVLTHDLSVLDQVVPREAFPSSARWLEGHELALLLFPRNVEYSLARLAQGPEEEADEDLCLTGLEGARLYLLLLEQWHDRVGRMDSSLRSQVAALLLTSGDPLAWFFLPAPAGSVPWLSRSGRPAGAPGRGGWDRRPGSRWIRVNWIVTWRRMASSTGATTASRYGRSSRPWHGKYWMPSTRTPSWWWRREPA